MVPLQRPLRIGTDCSGMETPIMALKHLKVAHVHVFSSDIDKNVKKQIEQNWGPEVFYDDLMARDNDAAPPCDLYIAGFPCQSFSSAGKQRGFKDKRGEVFFGCAEYIEAQKPRAFILENVRAILTNDRGRTWATVMRTLNNIDDGAYHVEYKILDTQEHAVPQSRRRVYIIGILKTALPAKFLSFPWPESLPLLSVEPLLEPVTKKPTMKDLPHKNYKTGYNNAREVLKDLQKNKQDPFQNTFLIDIDASERFRNKMKDRVMCMTKSRPSGYWISSRGRRMTITEMLKCQGMDPGSFEQVVPDKVLGAQIGNAMSQNVLERLFINLLPLAGLVPRKTVLEDRWALRAADPDWPRSSAEVKATTGCKAAKRKASVSQGVAKKRRTAA